MKTFFLILSLLFLSNLSFSQKIKFYGYVDTNFTTDTLYYSINKMEFSPENFIFLDKNKYKLELKINKKDKYLFFSNSLWKSDTPDKKEDCVHKYDLKKILKNFKDKNQDISIENDIIKSFNCGIWQAPFSLPENKKFEGKYEFTINGEKRSAEINSMFVQSILEKINDKLMSNETSNWSYNPNEKILKFTRVKQYNPNLGLELMIDEIYKFNVAEQNGILTFESQSENYQLKKL